MFSVTARANNAEQPKGGYIPISSFKKTLLQDGKALNKKENISASIVGRVVDYLTRYMLSGNAKEAFDVAYEGAKIAHKTSEAEQELRNITGLNKKTIYSAVSLIRFDTVRRTWSKKYADEVYQIPDDDTVSNIIVMVERCVHFLNEYGPVVLSGFTFEEGYTSFVSSGDGDYLTQDTIWDFKVLKNEPTSKHTLQIFMYYLMGLNSIHPEFVEVKNLGFYNPRLNTIYQLPVSDIQEDVLANVYSDVLMYNVSPAYVKVTLKDLTEYQRSKLAAKRVKQAAKTKQILEQQQYQEAMIYDRSLLKLIPASRRDATVCINALEGNWRRRKEDLGYGNEYYFYDCDSIRDLTDEKLERFLALVPDNSKTEDYFVQLIRNLGEKAIKYIPLGAYSVKVLESLFEHAKSDAKEILKTLIQETEVSQEMFDLMAEYGYIKNVPVANRGRNTYLNAIYSNSKNMKLVPEKYVDYQFMTEAVDVNPGAIAYIPENQLDDKLIISALSQSGKCLKYITPGCEHYLEYCKIALTNTKSARKYIPDSYLTPELLQFMDALDLINKKTMKK